MKELKEFKVTSEIIENFCKNNINSTNIENFIPNFLNYKKEFNKNNNNSLGHIPNILSVLLENYNKLSDYEFTNIVSNIFKYRYILQKENIVVESENQLFQMIHSIIKDIKIDKKEYIEEIKNSKDYNKELNVIKKSPNQGKEYKDELIYVLENIPENKKYNKLTDIEKIENILDSDLKELNLKYHYFYNDGISNLIIFRQENIETFNLIINELIYFLDRQINYNNIDALWFWRR